MPNIFFQAKYLWEHGDLEAGFECLRKAVADKIGSDPFARPDGLTDGSLVGSYEPFVANLLTGTFTNSARPFLLAPFGLVWAALWQLDPYVEWIDVLLGYDFFRAPEAVGFDEVEYAPPANTTAELDAMIQVLETSARSGELSADPREQSTGGRPVLTLESIDEVDDGRWGELKSRLRARLAAAFAASPADPWHHWLAADPERVAITFLHHVFGRHGGSTNASAAGRWEAISRLSPAYADASRKALAVIATSIAAERAAEIVKFDARRDAPDGLAWLRALQKALETGVFSDLA